MEMVKELEDNLKVVVTELNGFCEADIKTIIGGIRTDRPFSDKNFNAVMQKFPEELPYEMTKPTRSTFQISTISPMSSDEA